MTLEQAVKKLGGSNQVAALTGINRTTIDYWLRKTVPSWRAPDVARIIAMAKMSNRAPEAPIQPAGEAA